MVTRVYSTQELPSLSGNSLWLASHQASDWGGGRVSEQELDGKARACHRDELKSEAVTGTQGDRDLAELSLILFLLERKLWS